MQTVKWSFNPGPVATLATALLLLLLLTLGFWQLDRAVQKQALFDEYVAKLAAAPVDLHKALSAQLPTGDIVWRHATLHGKYVDAGMFLLDNQVLNGIPGYLVYAPFEIAGARDWVIINRGWIAAGKYRNRVPAIDRPEGVFTLTGTVTAFPSPPGLRLDNGDNATERMATGIQRMQVITQQGLEKSLGHTLFAHVLRLGPDSPTGLVRNWPQPGSGKERHLGYAFQWFSLAAALVIIYISVNLERRKPE